jgi:hypothetical protein
MVSRDDQVIRGIGGGGLAGARIDGGSDPDAHRGPWRFTRRLALGLSPTPALGLFVLLLGVALGPHGLSVMSRPVLSYLDPMASVALATLGVLVGFGLDVRRPHEGRLLAAASLEAGLTMVLVGAGVLVMLSIWAAPVALAPWLLALLLGICASASATTAAEASDSSRVLAAHIGDLDDLLPIVVGGIALAWMRDGSLASAVWLTAQSLCLALVVAVAAWLLVSQASADDEKRVFTIGSLLLLGGAAEALSLSALLTGLVAGIFWNLASDPAGDHIRRDVYYVQHPAVVLLLVIAGAHLDYSRLLPSLAVVYLVLRTTAKIAGGWLLERILAFDLTAHVGPRLISPGVVGVAFALNALLAGGSERMALVFAVVVVGSLGSELPSLLARARGASA